MKKNIIFVIIALISLCALVKGHSNKGEHKCIHDELMKNYTPDVEKLDDDRILLSGIEDEKKPFRVYFDTSALTDTVGTQAQRDFIIKDLLPMAAKFFRTRLNVRRRTKPVKLQYTRCYQANVPREHVDKGVDADLVIYVTALDTDEGYTAWAVNCLNDGVNGRPIAGHVNYNLRFLQLEPENFEMNLGTTLHEITHILGFSASNFLKFVNPQTGKVLNKSDVVESATLRGFETMLVKTPKVVEVAKKHFGCDSVKGVEVENQGGKGSLGSHWERTILMNEALTASRIENRAYSKFTLALLEDSGWYYPNYELADEFFYGEGAGCAFLQDGCMAEPRPREFCYEDQGAFCTLDYYFKGHCRADPFSDDCPFVVSYQNGDCRLTNNSQNYSVPLGEKYGPKSKCVIGNILDIKYKNELILLPKCVEYKCDNGKVTLTFANEKSVTCGKEGEKVSVDGYNGYIVCPSAKHFCETYYEDCPNYCSGKGKCIDGKCFCRPGRTGNDCSQLSSCASNCNNHGDCDSDGNCICYPGWKGTGCETENVFDLCIDVNCGANGVCKAGRCECNYGYSGLNCSDFFDPCKNKNCNNGTCVMGLCKCNSGWKGDSCNEVINLCDGIRCSNGACKNGTCICDSGWTGSRCNERVINNPCSNVVCKNGLCSNGICQCNKGWSGASCDVLQDPCATKTCGLHASCKGGNCVCNEGWEGVNCDRQKDPCFAIKCQNGVCSSGKCTCNPGWSGITCADKLDPCLSIYCTNGGKCSNGLCQCPSGYTGANCEKRQDLCENIKCGENGNCFNGKCICLNGWSGDFCTVAPAPVDPCKGVFCNSGTCSAGKCQCPAGWSGNFCEVRVTDSCTGVTCYNGGECQNGVCKCKPGYVGTKCEKYSSNGATCPNNCSGKGACLGGRCSCTYPAYSTDCSLTYEQGCVDNTCSKNGICMNKKCYCYSGFTGNNCEQKI